jgi:DNA replication protein DnaC
MRGWVRWGTVFPNATSIQALVDRFAQHCHVFDIEGPSWRHAHGEALRARTRKKER